MLSFFAQKGMVDVERRMDGMNVEVKINEQCTETKVLIETSQIDDQVKKLLDFVQKQQGELLSGLDEQGRYQILKPENILKIQVHGHDVEAVTCDQQVVQLKGPLFEFEEKLQPFHFFRISNSEIVNLNHVLFFENFFNGTISVTLDDQSKCYVSRRRVSSLKKFLGV